MSVQAILDNMDAVVAEATDGVLSDEQVKRYEELEAELAKANKSEEILKRNTAYRTNVTPVIRATASKSEDTLERAFEHYLRTGKENADIVELRAQGAVNGSEGGYTVPDKFRTKLVDRMKAFGGIANVAEEINTGDGNPLNWPTLDDTGNVGEIVAEGGTFASGADMVFGTATLGAYKYMAGGGSNAPLRVSVELLQDSAFDVEALVADKLGERIARIQSTHLVTGSGSNEPQGIIDGLTGVQLAANTGITYADLVAYVHSVDPAYRNGASWAFNDGTLARIRKLVDLDGRPLLQPQSTGSAASAMGGETLLGFPVTVDQAFPDVTLNSGTVNYGVFGNLREGYLIRRVRDVVVIANPWTRAANGQVEFTAWARMDAVQQNTNAYVALTGKA